MEKLAFTPVRIEDYAWIYEITSVYGENSCQHSPVSMYSMQEKYGDSVCERDGFLFTFRKELSDEEFRVYLAPLGEGNLSRAFHTILEDAASYGKKAKFMTLTEKHVVFLEKEFAGRFHIEENRDLAEYVYTTRSMSTFAGGKLAKIRGKVNRFQRLYGEQLEVKKIEESDFEDILAFEREWVEVNSETHDEKALKREMRFMKRQMEAYEQFRLFGVVMRIDGEVKGFSYGTKLSDDCYDGIIQKADRRIPNIYKALTMEVAKCCETECRYINIEEDLGLPGLRSLKMDYQPDHLISKYVVTEL